MKKFKNKAQKYGYWFGHGCQIVGFVTAMVFMAMIPNDYGDHVINTIPTILTLIGFAVGLYGIYRSGV